MKTTQQWLDEKVSDFKDDPLVAIGDMFANTNMVIEQYLNSPNEATKGVLESCLKHNKLFTEKLTEEML